ncbi:unnamed protein product, partial [Staurois parvus]
CPLCPPDTVEHRSLEGTSLRAPDHVITRWPISDHMQSSKQDVTCDIIAYYVPRGRAGGARSGRTSYDALPGLDNHAVAIIQL